MKAIFFLLLLSALALAEEGDPSIPKDFEMSKDKISEKYLAGAFLIYDCEEKHWVCVLKEDSDICKERREKAISTGEKNLPCAPIGEFPTKKSCFQRQLYLIGQAHGFRFCLLDQFKKEELE